MENKKLFFTTLFLALLEGMVVLSVELLGAKILTVYFGPSFIVWTSVLGITLASLTAGYLLGGWISAKKNISSEIALWILFSATAVIIFFLPYFSPGLLMYCFRFGIQAGSVLAAIILLSAPLICLGGISPLLIQLNSIHLNFSGKTAGWIYAVSTIGGIISCLLLGFWIIPSLGIKVPLICISIFILLVISVLLFEKKLILANIIALMAICFFWASGIMNPKIKESIYQQIYVSEGILGQIKVTDYFNSGAKVPIRFLTINEIPQAKNVNNPSEPGISYWNYPHIIGAMSSLKKSDGATALVCGFGGAAIASELFRLGFQTDIVEIDKRIIEVGLNYFYFNPAKTNFFIDDARHYIRATEKKYDLVVIDLLNGEVQPSYLFTTQSFEELKKIIFPNSIIIINYQGTTAMEKSIAVHSIFNTLMKSGFHTYYWSQQESINDDVFFFASLQPIDFSKLSPVNFNYCCMQFNAVEKFLQSHSLAHDTIFKNAMVLDDDKPMLENLNKEAILFWRKRMLEETNKRMKEGLPLFR